MKSEERPPCPCLAEDQSALEAITDEVLAKLATLFE